MKHLNVNELLSHFGDDTELLQQVVYEFCREVPHQVKLLKKACEANNWSEVYRLSHKIHGAAANFLKNPVSEIAKQMEVLAERNQTAGIAALSKHLEHSTNELCKELNQLTFDKVA